MGIKIEDVKLIQQQVNTGDSFIVKVKATEKIETWADLQSYQWSQLQGLKWNELGGAS